jgi:FtsP/CotA-like multicopper oxidase with cupredoxin domain
VAAEDRPVRIKFTNYLPTGEGGDLFLPVDTTEMGAGMGPNMSMAMTADRVGGAGTTVDIATMTPNNLQVGALVELTGFAPAAYNGRYRVSEVCDPMCFRVTLATDPGGPATDNMGSVMEDYTENRGTLHLHGGRTPWISDGTPHQWITPAGENTSYPEGVSVQNVPDMPDPGPGSSTFFYSNQQSARLMFYHDHSYGITRLNVYAGEAAGYLLTDAVEQDLITRGILPDVGTPLVIQEKTFIDPMTVLTTDPTWPFPVDDAMNDLWYPHVYMPNQNPNSLDGANAMGRWDYGPFFWPPWPAANPPIEVPDGSLGFGFDGMPDLLPNVPDLSMTMEAFLDTPLVNGTVYPFMDVQPQAYRFRVLNASNDRMWNLQLYTASTIVSRITVTNGGSGYSSANPPCVTITPDPLDTTGMGATAFHPVIDPVTGALTAINLNTVGSEYTLPPLVTIDPPPPGGTQATATATIYTGSTEVGMVPAVPCAADFPAAWTVQTLGQPGDILDNRAGGVPDPRTIGPSMVQIGTEGGFLPSPVIWPNIPIGFERNPKNIVVLNVKEHNLFLGPAERADVVIDFSQFAGKTVILYNDGPAAVPAADSRLDYYTADVDQTDSGGTVSTLPGYGPNTRTIMAFRVAAGTPQPYDLTALQNEFITTPTHEGVFVRDQDPIIVPQAAYNSAYGLSGVGTDTFPAGGTAYERIQSTSLTFKPLDLSTPALADQVATPVTIVNNPKAIAEEFESTYGRMSGFMGVEVPFTNGQNQTTIWYGYIDPVTEVINNTANPLMTPIGSLADGTQIWKITHNGVDTHPVHFHLFDVQLINRVGWDGQIVPPDPNELGWKETVRMNPLQDCIVALRPVASKQPFGLPDSVRLLDPTMPQGSTVGFKNVDPNGNPITVTNEPYNFGWEYMWHCHILSHEEMDMMRPIQFNVARELAEAPVLTSTKRFFGSETLTMTQYGACACPA